MSLQAYLSTSHEWASVWMIWKHDKVKILSCDRVIWCGYVYSHEGQRPQRIGDRFVHENTFNVHYLHLYTCILVYYRQVPLCLNYGDMVSTVNTNYVIIHRIWMILEWIIIRSSPNCLMDRNSAHINGIFISHKDNRVDDVKNSLCCTPPALHCGRQGDHPAL